MGFSDFRVRVRGNDAVLQFISSQIDKAWHVREDIKLAIKPYFNNASLDMSARADSA